MSQKRKDIPVNGNWALSAWWQELFCVIEELETIPPDLFTEDYSLNRQNYPDVGKASTTNTGGVLLYRLISDRQDPEQLRKVVESRMAQYAKQHPDVDLEFHILNENAKLNDCKNDLFKNWETKVGHYNNRKIIDAYKRALNAFANQKIWRGVFHSSDEYEKFRYLHENYTNDQKNRWTYIYYGLYQGFKITHLAAAPFLRWIKEHYAPDLGALHKQNHVVEMGNELVELVRKYTPVT